MVRFGVRVRRSGVGDAFRGGRGSLGGVGGYAFSAGERSSICENSFSVTEKLVIAAGKQNDSLLPRCSLAACSRFLTCLVKAGHAPFARTKTGWDNLKFGADITYTYIYGGIYIYKYIIRNLIKPLTHDVSISCKYQISNYSSPKSLVNNLLT